MSSRFHENYFSLPDYLVVSAQTAGDVDASISCILSRERMAVEDRIEGFACKKRESLVALQLYARGKLCAHLYESSMEMEDH